MKIGILTTFGGSDEAYSLVVVVKTQLQMLKKYNPALFVCPSFKGEGIFSDKQTDIRKTIISDAQAEDIIQALEPKLLDIDVMICHDIIFLTQHTQWAKAICDIATRHPNIAWVHWQHSRGDGHTNEHPENSWWAYPNQGDLAHCAEINSAPLDRVRYIPHTLDFAYLGWPELAIQIAEDFDFPFVDISGILPARLDRHKQVEKAVRIFAGLKKAGKSVCFLIADAYATGERFIQYKREVEEIAKEQGLTKKEFSFLGEVYPDCRYGTPRQVVKALYEMSNLFIQPSNAETSSLVAMEAALAGNLIVINADFPPIHHLYKKALALPFGSVFEDTKYYRNIKTADGADVKIEDAQLFWDDNARNTIIPIMDSQLTLQVKRQQLKERWPYNVLINNVLPLIKDAYAASPHAAVSKRGDPDITAIVTTLDNLNMLRIQLNILQDECGHIIVINNGSIDGTKEWLEENIQEGVSYINRENKGAGPGRNAGINLWNNSTPYVLFVDGGILPPVGGAKALKDYLIRHPDADVISPEIASCFTTNEKEATLRINEPVPDQTFWQRCLSSTAYCMTNQRAWNGLRFSEEGPFGEPGWGVDDNDMAYRWDEANIKHDEFTNSSSGWKLYRRAGGSHQRLFEETGVWPTQYGSVYEKRVVKTFQDWRAYHAPMTGYLGTPSASYIIKGVPMPIFARVVKRLHDTDKNYEIIADDYNPEVKWWLDTFALRWPWGDCTFDPDGNKLIRGQDYPEELWSGDVVRNRGPLSSNVRTITMQEIGDLFRISQKENAYFRPTDPQAVQIRGFPIDPGWWSRIYEYPWAIQFAEYGQIVADMGCGWMGRPFKDALARACEKVYAVDQHWEVEKLDKQDGVEFVVADFTKRIEAIPDESLDRVFCISVLEEVGDKILLALQEFYRCLKHEGKCIVTVDVQYDMDKPADASPVVKLDVLEAAAKKAGFEIRGDFNDTKENVIFHEGLNLCVFHCVLVKL